MVNLLRGSVVTMFALKLVTWQHCFRMSNHYNSSVQTAALALSCQVEIDARNSARQVGGRWGGGGTPSPVTKIAPLTEDYRKHREQTIESPVSAIFLKFCGWGICTPNFISLDRVVQSLKFLFKHPDLMGSYVYIRPQLELIRISTLYTLWLQGHS